MTFREFRYQDFTLTVGYDAEVVSITGTWLILHKPIASVWVTDEALLGLARRVVRHGEPTGNALAIAELVEFMDDYFSGMFPLMLRLDMRNLFLAAEKGRLGTPQESQESPPIPTIEEVERGAAETASMELEREEMTGE